MPVYDAPPAQALGLGKQYIILPDLLHELVAHHIGVVPKMAEHQHGKRQNQMAQTAEKIARLADGIGAAGGEPAEIDAKDQNQDKRNPKRGDTICDGADLADEFIHKAVLMQGAEHAEEQRQAKGAYIGKAA